HVRADVAAGRGRAADLDGEGPGAAPYIEHVQPRPQHAEQARMAVRERTRHHDAERLAGDRATVRTRERHAGSATRVRAASTRMRAPVPITVVDSRSSMIAGPANAR